MDFLNGKIKTIYFKYLSAAFGSALITSIYSIVDMAMVGQYHGPEGSAALAVVAPVWTIRKMSYMPGSWRIIWKRGRKSTRKNTR